MALLFLTNNLATFAAALIVLVVLAFDPSTGNRSTYEDVTTEEVHYVGGYFDCDAGQEIKPVLSYNKTYNIYLLANVSSSHLNVNLDDITKESERAGIKWTMPEYKTKGYAWIQNAANAFPMTNVYLNHNTKTNGTSFAVKLLFGEYVITLVSE